MDGGHTCGSYYQLEVYSHAHYALDLQMLHCVGQQLLYHRRTVSVAGR